MQGRSDTASPGMDRLIEYLLIIIKHSAIRRERETNIQGGGRNSKNRTKDRRKILYLLYLLNVITHIKTIE